MELSSPKLKKLLFLGEPLRVFHHCFFRGFHFSPLIFTTVFRVFSLLIAFFHVTNFVAFLSGTSLLCCCTVSATDLRGLFFYSQAFLPYTPSQHLAQSAFIMASLGVDSSSLKAAGPPTEVRNSEPVYLFV